MLDIGTRLKDADPVHREPGLTAAELGVMRQTVVAAARISDMPQGVWQTLVIATAVALVLAVAIVVDRRGAAPDGSERNGAVGTSSAATDARRQLQFATPGGTRVIWVFDSKFQP